ncbi:MAG: HDOD domain-containing protein [Planctomycetota bacterium]
MANWVLITSEDLPTLPHVATKVLQVVNNPETTPRDLQRVIEADQALTERLLRMANSAMFAGTQSVVNLHQAITRLGFNRVRTMVLVASTKDVCHSPSPTALELWRHSLGVAVGCRLVGQAAGFGRDALDDLVLAGLFHDVGKVLMNHQRPDKYQEIIQVAVEQRRPTSELEKEVFRFTHEEVGALILKKWKLPENLIEPVRHHHAIQNEDFACESYLRETAAVATADLIANMLGIGLLTSVSIDPVGARSTRVLGITEEQVLPILEELPDLFLKESEALGA